MKRGFLTGNATAIEDRDALSSGGLAATGIDVHQQLADFAAGERKSHHERGEAAAQFSPSPTVMVPDPRWCSIRASCVTSRCRSSKGPRELRGRARGGAAAGRRGMQPVLWGARGPAGLQGRHQRGRSSCSRCRCELIAGFQAQLGDVGLADEQVAAELDLGVEAQAAARPPANSEGGKPRSQSLEAALLDPPPGWSPVLIGRPVGPLDRPRWQRTPDLLHPHHHTQPCCFRSLTAYRW